MNTEHQFPWNYSLTIAHSQFKYYLYLLYVVLQEYIFWTYTMDQSGYVG